MGNPPCSTWPDRLAGRSVSGRVLALPVLKTAAKPLVFVSEDHVVVVDFNSTFRPGSLVLLPDRPEKTFLELAQLGVDADPVLDVALRHRCHRDGFAGQQDVVVA